MKALSVALKDLQILLQDRGALVMSFLLPIVFILAFSLPQLAGVSSEEDLLSLPVVNMDTDSTASQAFIDGLDAAGGVRTELYARDKAWDLLGEGEIDWLLEIPADFSQMSMDHAVTLRLVSHPDANETETQSIFLLVNGVARDMALENQLIASFEQMGAMMEAGPEEHQAFTAEVYIAQAKSQFEHSKTTPLVSVEQTTPQVEGEEISSGGTQITVPGFTVLFVFLTAQTTALSIFQEKTQGSFRRLLAAPISRAGLLVGKMLPNLAMTLLQIIVIFSVGVFLLPLMGLDRLTLGNDPLALIVVSLLLALCSTGIGVFIAAIAQTETQIGGISAVVLWVLAALGGSFYPTYLMSGPLKTVGSFVPHYWALQAYHNLFVYGRGLADIMPSLAALLGFTVAFFAIGLWRFDFE